MVPFVVLVNHGLSYDQSKLATLDTLNRFEVFTAYQLGVVFISYPPPSRFSCTVGIINLWSGYLEEVILFVDWQNVYKLARKSFFNIVDPNFNGQINPLLLGQHLIDRNAQIRKSKSMAPQRLKQIRIYCGIPDPIFDRPGNERMRRQISAWTRLDSKIKVIQRTLKYPKGWPNPDVAGTKPREKGVDIALAVDFVSMAARSEFDTGILFSADTDFKPVLEFVTPDGIRARAEVAAWKADVNTNIANKTYNQRLSLDGKGNLPFCHWLSVDDYHIIKDHTNYNIGNS